MTPNQTLTYYNKNAQQFTRTTQTIDFTATQQRFLDKLPVGGLILDFGCGSGRDTKAFLERGFQAEAIDGSEELCKIASEYTGITVRQILFQEWEEINKYDGIWACSSILHIKRQELPDIIRKMVRALKEQGIIYVSFKYGTFEGERNGRYFTDMTEDVFSNMIKDMDNLQIEEQWMTSDVRPGRGEEKWLNLILRKK